LSTSGRVVPDPTTLSFTPEFMLNYGVTFDYPDFDFRASVNANYFGSRWVQNWDTADYTNYEAPWERYGAFTVVNFSLAKKIYDFEDKGNLVLKTSVDNVLNIDYAYTMGYPLPGRNFYVGLEYNF
jgi:vitamin B12 transporter